MWTIEWVKEELPIVKVELGDGTIVDGQVAGRKEELFATVFIELYKTSFSAMFAWSTIVHTLNAGRSLLW